MAKSLKKKSTKRALTTAVDPFAAWKDKTINAHFAWDQGVDHLKGNPKGIFTLKAVQISDGSGGSKTAFQVNFKKDQMPVYWQCVLLQGTGKDDPPSGIKLPKLKDLTFADMLVELATTIQKTKAKQSTIKRLEGFLEVPSMGGNPATIIQARMVYLEKVMDPDTAGKPKRDFVLVIFRDSAGGEDPNGGGSGPPD